MHVLFVTGWWPTEENPLNGIFIKEHAIAISKYAKVTVVFLNKVEKSGYWSDFPATFKKNISIINQNLQVIIYDAKFKIRRFGVLEWQITKLIKDLINQFDSTNPVDIIHLNILHFFLPSHILENSKIFKKPIVLTEHSTYLHTEINYLPEDKAIERKNELKELLSNSFLKFVLPVSNQLGEVFIKDYHTPPEKIITIANVANDCFLDKKIERNKIENKIVIFAAATWQDSKDPFIFFNMLKLVRLNNKEIYSRLIINWAGAGNYLEEIKSVAQNDFPDLNIRFLGHIDKSTIANQMSNSHFLVHPTIAENLPCIIIESLCIGLPVLTANVNGCKELLDDSNGMLYQSKDVNDLYLKFLLIIKNINSFNNNWIAIEAKNKYSPMAIGMQITDVYKKILAK